MEDKISAEYARLKALFQNVEPTKAELVDDLVSKAAFLKVELDGGRIILRKNVTEALRKARGA